MDTHTTHTTDKPRFDRVKTLTPGEDETGIPAIWISRGRSFLDLCVISHAAEGQGAPDYTHGWGLRDICY
jgi:hypothetical protein